MIIDLTPSRPFIFDALIQKYKDIAFFFNTIGPHFLDNFYELNKISQVTQFYSPSNKSQRRSHTAFINSLPDSLKERVNQHIFYTKKDEDRLFELFYKNQRTRFYLKAFIFRWRSKKWSKRELNTDDPFTLFPPDKSLILFDPQSKGFYNFDPTALLKHIHKSLLNHYGTIDEPFFPKNPFTNIPFSIGQLIIIYNSLIARGVRHWVFDLFQQSQFSLGKLQNNHAYSLKKAALYATLNDKTSYQYQDFLIEFIRQEFEEHDQLFQIIVYRWAVKHYLQSDYMQSWEKLAKESALMDIQWECLNQTVNFNRINYMAKYIIFNDKEVKKLHTEYFKWRKQQYANLHPTVAIIFIDSFLDENSL